MDRLDSEINCRLCMSNGVKSIDKFANLFTKTIKESLPLLSESNVEFTDYVLNMSLVSALESFTCLEFKQDDDLPQSICFKCEYSLVNTIHFIHHSKANQQIINACPKQCVTKEERNIDIDDESTYMIEILHDDDDDVVYDVECDSQVSAELDADLNNEYSEQNDDGEDAVSFLKNVQREDGKRADMPAKNVKKNHSCNYCKKEFLRKSNLIDHLRLHANVRPFSCNYCDKSFVQSGNLKSHLRTHTKERPFQCLLCTKSYSQSSALKVHYRTHTNERNYGCEVCAKHFTNASDLTKHKRIHDPDSKISCEYCDRKFAQRVNYLNHLRSNHAENIKDSTTKKPKKSLVNEN